MKLATIAVSVGILALSASSSNAQSHKPRKPAADPAPGPAPTTYTIEVLTVEGNHVYTAEQIFAASGLGVGKKAGPAEFDAARDKLSATGAFDNVSYHYAPSKDAEGYDVGFEVSEIGQLYPLRFDELPATDAQLRAWLKQKDPLFGDKVPATKPVVDRYVGWISEFLAAHGNHTAVAGKLTAEGGEELTLLFRPAKTPASVAHVVFTNTGDLAAGVLQTAMYQVAIGVQYSEPKYRELLENQIRPIYEAHGLVRVSFPKIEVAPAKDVDGITVTTRVEQGPVYKLGAVRYVGGDFSRKELKDLSKLKPDDPVNFDDVKAAQGRFRESLRRQGYLDASSQVKRTVKDADHTVDLTILIDPGPLYTLGKLNISGLDIVSEPVILKMWGMSPGRPFNPDYPDHFLARVKEAGVFDNLKSTRAETNINASKHTVDVTLYFNK
ncbi:MAG TPA: POTRA domain-containing protein [Bryobacteraceae bacterium]|nr:POTRA domain-containing protein [Bryobacteraceae bacterium]